MYAKEQKLLQKSIKETKDAGQKKFAHQERQKPQIGLPEPERRQESRNAINCHKKQ
jgi:hypothetical protein